MEQFTIAVGSHPGKQRDRNEVAALATLGVTPAMRGVLIAVADCMGGEPAGDRASSIAIEVVGATRTDTAYTMQVNDQVVTFIAH